MANYWDAFEKRRHVKLALWSQDNALGRADKEVTMPDIHMALKKFTPVWKVLSK